MKKFTLTAIVIFALLGLLVTGLQAVEVAKANFFHPTQPMPYITISSPKNQVFNQSVIPFKTQIFCKNSSVDDTGVKFGTLEEVGIHFETLKWLNYSIDGKVYSIEWTFPPNSYSGVNNTLAWYYIPCVSYTDTNLTNLSDGEHFLSVYGETIFNAPVSANVSFTIDTTSYNHNNITSK